jgi:hypothetical protein
MRNLATIGLAGLSLFVAIAVVVSPQWLTTGRFHTIVWTRATEALGMNPTLPTDQLNDMYPCKQFVPGGFRQALVTKELDASSWLMS